nr:MAG TPA: hypothetical protein [Caudoviricetes sp.]
MREGGVANKRPPYCFDGHPKNTPEGIFSGSKPGRRERKHHGESPKVVSTGPDPRSSRANHDCISDG